MATSQPSTPVSSQSVGGDTSADSAGTCGSSNKRGRGPSHGQTILEEGEKKILKIDEFGRPYAPRADVGTFQSAIGTLVRRDLPIRAKFSEVPLELVQCLINQLGKSYEFQDIGSVDLDYTLNRIKARYNDYKSELHINFVKGKVANEVKEKPPPFRIPLEDWKNFVDHCNTDKFKAASERNSANRAKQQSPSTLGRNSIALIRHEMAEKKKVADHDIGRCEMYLRSHTRKDKTVQCPEIANKINEIISSNPSSRLTGIDDALTQAVGKDSRGRMRGMGGNVSKTVVSKMSPLLKKNAALTKEKNKMDSVIEGLQESFAQVLATVEEMKRSQAAIQGTHSNNATANPTVGPSLPNAELILRECNLKAGWPMKVVARGYVSDVDPIGVVGERVVGQGRFDVYVTHVFVPDTMLPFPHDEWRVKLGEIGQGHVIWSSDALELL